MKLIKTTSEFYGSDRKGSDFTIMVNDECFDVNSELLFIVKPTLTDKWFSPAEYRLFLAKILESINDLEIIYYGKTDDSGRF